MGTLGEFALAWNHINIDFRVNQKSSKHAICFRDPWEKFFNGACESLGLVPLDRENIHFVDTVPEAVALVKSINDQIGA